MKARFGVQIEGPDLSRSWTSIAKKMTFELESHQEMRAKLLETEIICLLDYAPLGLKDSSKDYLGKPRVLWLLSTLLERSVQKNERMLETSQSKDVVTIFHGLRAPSLSIRQYIDRIFKYSCCSPSCFVIAHVYLDRYIQRTNLCLTNLNIHRLLIISVMVAAKFMDDKFFNNAYYARVGGVTTAELNKLEMKFLFGLDFRLHVSVQTFRKYCSVLKKESTNGFMEESCRNKEDESACPRSNA